MSLPALAISLGSLCSFLFLLTPTAQSQSILFDPTNQIPEVDPTFHQQLLQVETLIQAHQVDDAIQLLQRIEDSHPQRLAPSPNQPLHPDFPATRFLPVPSHLNALRRHWASSATDVWQAYLSLNDPAKQHRFQRIKQNPLPTPSQSTWSHFLASSMQPEAMLEAAGHAFQHGRLQLARTYFQQVDPSLRAQLSPNPSPHPTSIPWAYVLQVDHPSLDPAQLLSPQPSSPLPNPSFLAEAWAGLVQCSLAEGDTPRARLEAQMLASLLPHERSSTTQQTWADMTRSWLAKAHPSPTLPLSQPLDWPLVSTWHQPLPEHTLKSDPDHTWPKRDAESDLGLLVYEPTLAAPYLWVNQLHRIEAFHIDSGHPLSQDKFRSTYESGLTFDDLTPLSYPIGGSPRASATRHNHLLFARVGSPVTAWNTRSGLNPQTSSAIVALDLRQNGKLLPGYPLRWQDPSLPDAEFEGTPLIIDQHLFVVLTQRTSLQLRRCVACFDVHSTQCLWKTPILAAGSIEGIENRHWMSHLTLSTKDGRIFLDTGLGAIVALDQDTGDIVWLVRYPRDSMEKDRHPQAAAYRYRDRTPPWLFRDLVICSPADSRSIFALDFASGDLVWFTDPDWAGSIEHQLGSDGETLFWSGSRIFAMDPRTGQWLDRFPRDGPGHLLGRGTRVQQRWLLPESQQLLDIGWDPSQKTFHSPTRHPLGPAFRDGAILSNFPDFLVATTPQRIALFRLPPIPQSPPTPTP